MTKAKKSSVDVFVIMPFEQSPTRDHEQLKSFFSNQLRQPIESADELEYDYRVYRSGEDFNITKQIIKDLYHADIVIADLSGQTPNPNVMYELGVRLALSDDPVILIREDDDDNRDVFDVDHYFTYEYDPLDYPSLQEHLINKLRRLETGEDSYTSPVTGVLGTELALERSGLEDISSERQIEMVARGVTQLTKTLERAFGPSGTAVRVPDRVGSGRQRSTRRGSEICEAFSSSNPFEQVGFDVLKTVSDELDERFGDGTKLAPLLAGALIAECHEPLRAGESRSSIVDGLRVAESALLDFIDEQSRLLNSKEDAEAISRTASGSSEIGLKAASLLEEIGPDGTVTVEVGDTGVEDSITTRSGYQLSSGYSDPVFTEDQGDWTVAKCMVLLFTGRIVSSNELVPVLEKVQTEGEPLLIIAGDTQDEASTTLAVNRQRGVLNSIAVSLSGRDDLRAIMRDIAVGSEATVISEEAGRRLDGVVLDDLGHLTDVRVGQSSTDFKFPERTLDKRQERAEQLRERVDNESGYRAQRLGDRLAMLVGQRGEVRVGGRTRQERQDRLYRWQSAVRALYFAIARGGLLGGGISLLRGRDHILESGIGDKSSDVGVRAFCRALERPARALINSTELNVDSTIQILREAEDKSTGVDVLVQEIASLSDRGVLDPAIIVRESIEKASSAAQSYLQTENWQPAASASHS